MADNLIGTTLGQYQIIELAGKGGMATVYKAFQPSLNRYVALKVLPEFLAQDKQFVARFRQEALAAAALRHPNILVIHDVGQVGNLHYIAMEYLEGQTLSDVIQQTGGLSPQRTVKIFDQLASALDFAHRRGLVHRDIKPANIFIGADDHVTLVDFGIVKALSGMGLTSTKAMIGTPEYMSPEQIEGKSIDQRSDLYSLGVVLYQMLTGYVPFGGEATSAILFAHLNKSPTPPSKLTAFVTPQVEAVVMRALAKNPQERFANVKEMAQALSQAVAAPAAPVYATAPVQAYTPAPPPTYIPQPAIAYAPAPVAPSRSGSVLWPILFGLGALVLIAVAVVVLLASGILKTGGGLRSTLNVTATSTAVEQVAAVPTATSRPTDTSTPQRASATPLRSPTAPPTSAPTMTSTPVPASPTTARTATSGPTRPVATTRPGMLFDFETMGSWRRGDQANGTLAQSSQQAHSGQSSARLDYNFPSSGNDFVVFINEVSLSGQPNAIGAWVYGDGSGHFLNAWIKDNGGEVWQVPMGRVGSAGWKQMAGSIATGQKWPWTHISGPDNGQVDYPIKFYALVLDDSTDAYSGKGTIYIDDISVWRGDNTPTPAAGASSATGATQTPAVQTPGAASEPRTITLQSPSLGANLKSSVITFKWTGGALQSGETFLVEVIPIRAEKKGECVEESDYGSNGRQYSPSLTAHEWTADIAAVPAGKYKPCAGRIEWRVHIRDSAGNVIQSLSTPRAYFVWNPL
jgi:serine/threonine protein kinase